MTYYWIPYKSTPYLSHHGIKGQKWGVRRWQYRDGSLTPEGYPHYGYNGPRAKKAQEAKSARRVKFGDYVHDSSGKLFKVNDADGSKTFVDDSQLLKDAKSKVDHNPGGSHGPLVAWAIRTGLWTATMNPLGLAYEAYRGGQALNAHQKEKAAMRRINSGQLDEKSGLHLKMNQCSAEDDMKAVNPGFKNFNTNTKNNCVLCTTAFELRRRGYDVIAAKASDGYFESEYVKWFKNSTVESMHGLDPGNYTNDTYANTTAKDIKKWATEKLLAQGDGARGNLVVMWSMGGGHSMAYEVKNQKVIIYDSQCGKKQSLSDLAALSIDIGFTRLDDKEPDFDQMRKDGVIK